MTRPMTEKQLNERAREWLIHLESGDATAEDRQRFEQWLDENPAHSAAYEWVSGIWQDVSLMDQLAQVEPRYIRQKPRSSLWDWHLLFRPQAVFAVATLVIAVTVTFIVLNQPKPITGDNYVTEVAEIRDIVLDDGSVVTLGAKSQVTVAVSHTERRVVLQGGEAFFQVTADPQRPFVVSSADVNVRVLGTSFNVHAGERQVTVGVAEGLVEVVKSKQALLPFLAPEPERQQLKAGQRVAAVHEGVIQAVQSVRPEDVDSWRSGRLIYENALLRDVIADANRYSSKQIVLGEDALSMLTVTAAFQTNKIDELVDWLATVLPVRAEQARTGEIRLMPQSGSPQ